MKNILFIALRWICLLFLSPAYAHKLELISVGQDGKAAGACLSSVDISSDGRFVVFCSKSPDIVEGDTNWVNPAPFEAGPGSDIFLCDRKTNITTRISITNEGKQIVTGNSVDPHISGDGRFVVYSSQATDIVPGDLSPGDGGDDIYQIDLQTYMTKFITAYNHIRDPEVHDWYPSLSCYPDISGNGCYLVYHYATIYDLLTNQRETIPGGSGYDQVITTDGRYIAFSSYQVVVYDRQSGEKELISRSYQDGSVPGDAESYNPHISDDGRYVLYESEASNLVSNDPHTSPYKTRGIDSFIFDREANETTIVSLGKYDSDSYDNGARFSTLSPDGRYVVFSIHNEYSPKGLYRFDRVTKKTDRLITIEEINKAYDVQIAGFSGDKAISQDGKTIVFFCNGVTPPYAYFWIDKIINSNVFLLEMDDDSEIEDWPLQ